MDSGSIQFSLPELMESITVSIFFAPKIAGVEWDKVEKFGEPVKTKKPPGTHLKLLFLSFPFTAGMYLSLPRVLIEVYCVCKHITYIIRPS